MALDPARPPAWADVFTYAISASGSAPAAQGGLAERQAAETLSGIALATTVERLVPIRETETPYGPLRWYGFGRMAWKRPAWRKGLEINAWIDTLPAGSVLWDVGANIGVYTLYAARKGIKTVAFEPEAGSFFVLQKNIDINGLAGKAMALNVAMAETAGMQRFALANDEVGTARHALTDGMGGQYRYVQAVTAMSLIGLVPVPQYIKIDVDGAELSVLRGLGAVLDEASGVVVECRDNGDQPTVEALLASYGYRLDDVAEGMGGHVRDVFFRRCD